MKMIVKKDQKKDLEVYYKNFTLYESYILLFDDRL